MEELLQAFTDQALFNITSDHNIMHDGIAGMYTD